MTRKVEILTNNKKCSMLSAIVFKYDVEQINEC